ncbi:ImmA/IrrE family metallo-endopeptidase [Methanobrevibacter oralis]|uniref:ImmA/IrrE family metallo-endopeptidase n=1 Tax=Methanobrevibacter oralis TaxID=66851 RepID=UPI000693822D|nr:ImmA/IrrE family metallo-endopeptidase [Methanobrevibacter oralis]
MDERKKHYSFLNNWKEIITNKLGILIFETEGVEIEEMRGLCILHDKIPIILLNGKDEPNGRIFTLFHELTHLLLGESAICGDDMNKSIEIFCNSVAGEFLVPEHDLLENINNSDLSDESLKGLYNTYGVSEYVILRRLFDLNKITKTEYDSKIDHYINFNTNTDDESKGFYLYNMVKYNGRPFYSLVLEAYDYGIISSLEFSKYTNLGQKQIPKLQEILFGGEQ